MVPSKDSSFKKVFLILFLFLLIGHYDYNSNYYNAYYHGDFYKIPCLATYPHIPYIFYWTGLD